MTREQFIKGWAFLVAQPWGRIYDGRLEPEKTQLQFELYYSRLAWVSESVWREVALLFASGSDWPSLEELLASCRTRHQRTLKLAAPTEQAESVSNPEWEKTVQNLTRILGKPFNPTIKGGRS